MKYFTLSELYRSAVANSRHIDNHPTPEIVDNLETLINECLDPIREFYGKPILVTSGYRSEELNKIVHGSKTSHHLKGLAADIKAKDGNHRKLFDAILKSGVPFTQLIWEYGDLKCPAWVHISYDKNNLKKQVLYLT